MLHVDISDNSTVAVLLKFECMGAKCKTIGIDAVGKMWREVH
jgi:hypothetical protein